MKPDLSQLRDIHPPPPVSWWPPAPGWWALLALLLIAGVFAYVMYLRRRRNRWRDSALAELARLKNAPSDRVFRDLSVLLRRVAINRFPRRDVASLTGEDWLAFLDLSLGDESTFQSEVGRVLLSGPYNGESQVDATPLLILCERWIKQLPRKGAV